MVGVDATEAKLPPAMHSSSATEAASTGDILQRSLDMLERSQTNLEASLANLERSLAIENTLSRLVDSQEELRQMMLALLNGTDVPVAFPALPERDPAAPVKNEEEEEEEDEIDIESSDLSVTNPPTPFVESDEEDDDLSSVSSVSSEEDIDIDDDDTIETQSSVSAPKGSDSRSLRTKEDDLENDETLRVDSPRREGSHSSSAQDIAKCKQAIWKCAVCEKRIKGDWFARRQHIETHEGLRVSCPVKGCYVRRGMNNLQTHLKKVHKMTKDALPSERRTRLQSEVHRNNQIAKERQMEYFPPSSLDSFVETSRRDKKTKREEVERACKMCGKVLVGLNLIREHVAVHRNRGIPCPLSDCDHYGRVRTIILHLRRIHGTALRKLTEGERERFDESRRKLYKKMDRVMGKYFSSVV
uniref:C2H2-type domain-containing protein n=1 Tax=Steinernema glaseri TaxID=37863 RepID=A0A1I7ZZE3_9BILA